MCKFAVYKTVDMKPMTTIVRNILRYAVSATLFALTLQGSALNLPQKTINGHTYYIYQVQPRETIYSLCKSLGVTKEDVVKYNPTVADGLRAYQTLYFPTEAFQSLTTESTSPSTPSTYTVKNGDTIYGICKDNGITTGELLAANPNIADGIKVGMTLTIPQKGQSKQPSEAKASQPNNSGYVYHNISQGETLYSLAKQYDTSVENILLSNPGLAPDNYTAGSTIRILPGKNAVTDHAAAVTAHPNHKTYRVKKDETLYSIARKHGITVADIEEANPGLSTIEKDQLIFIPDKKKTKKNEQAKQKEPKKDTADDIQVCPIEEESPTPMPDVHREARPREVRLCVMLPFMLSQEKPEKQALLYTDFYKGLLIAVDSLRNSRTPIHITAFDTANSLDTVNMLLKRPEMKDMDVIIGADDDAQLAAISRFATSNDINVLNLFSIKSTLYTDSPCMIQGNIPHDLMYSKAIEGFLSTMQGRTPVFLSRNERGDKEEFISMLKETLDAKGITYKEIRYHEFLSVGDLASLDETTNYTFIPQSGSHSEFSKIINALRKYKSEAIDPDHVQLFGYPEWITFRGELRERMQYVNTTIYSRFYSDADSYRTKDIDERFKKWYGRSMMLAVPMQGTLGFDTGMFLIKALSNGNLRDGKYIYDGVQNGFYLVRPDKNGGLVNELLYMINFRPSGITERITIE